MAITPIQPNIDNTKSHIPYAEAKGTIKTDKNIKPLKPEGHLVHDTLISVPKFFLKDIAYDIKAVKDGFKGTANDHQTGRLNDVGIKLGGIGIATYLASKTTNPMYRLMEYIGLGAFLTGMALYPKAAINVPSRVVHGFSIGKEYIDDQGRKKSVFQDSNYIPFDMYRGEYPGEDLDIIGDRMGIPRNIENRHDLIKEQMRKIATQNNTLWMLTAGFATPLIAGLSCCGLERLIAPAMEKARNYRYDNKIAKALEKTQNMTMNISEIEGNSLSKKVEKLLSNYKNKELPKIEYKNLVDIMTNHLDEKMSSGIRQDLENIFKGEKNGFVLGEKVSEDVISSIKNELPANKKTVLEKVFVPTKEELDAIFKNRETVTQDELKSIKEDLKKLFNEKIQKEANKEYLNAQRNRIIEKVSKNIQKNPSSYVSENSIKEVVDFAKIIGEFKANDKVLDSCKSFKFEHSPETVLARSYQKFESTLLDVLGVTHKETKIMRQSRDLAKKELVKKLEVLAKDDAKYKKAVSKLAKVMAEMETSLHGKDASKSNVTDLISAIENNYNNTARRLNQSGKFKNTIEKMIREDASDVIENTIKDKAGAFDFLDGLVKGTSMEDVKKALEQKGIKDNLEEITNLEYSKMNSKGVGSSKQLQITRILERYQGVKNSQNRIMHLLDVYRRTPNDAHQKAMLEKGKEVLIGATTSDHMLKVGTTNNPEYYKEFMNYIWKDSVNARDLIKSKGELEEITKKAMGASDDIANANVLERMQTYISRFKNILGNNDIDFTKLDHRFENSGDILDKYSKHSKTRVAKFNLVAQNPAELVRQAAERRYGNNKWVKTASIILGSVLGVTLISQFFFGKISNPQNIKKQVSDDNNK